MPEALGYSKFFAIDSGQIIITLIGLVCREMNNGSEMGRVDQHLLFSFVLGCLDGCASYNKSERSTKFISVNLRWLRST